MNKTARLSDPAMIRRRKIAERIAQCLFTNGLNQAAARLVLEMPTGPNGGGWCRAAVVDQIAAVLALEHVS